MPVIRPISDLRNHATKLSAICHAVGEPIFLTNHGDVDLVVMSLALYERLQAQLDLYLQLDEAEAEVRAGKRGAAVATVRKRLRHRAYRGLL